MAMHEPDWVEYRRSGGTVYFRCRACGKTLTGNEKSYDAGKWFPSLGRHDG